MVRTKSFVVLGTLAVGVVALLWGVAAPIALGEHRGVLPSEETHAARGDVDSRVDHLRRSFVDGTGENVLVVAHRGFHQDHPENSLGAIDAAIEIGSHIVEIDVHETSDGHLVLMHDWDVGRTTTGWGEMDSFTLAEIRELYLLHGIRVTSERVPTLQEALEVARGQVLINVDHKGLALSRCVEEVARLGMLDHCIFKIGWSPEGEATALRIQQRWPDALIMPIVRSTEQLNRALKHSTTVPIEFSNGNSEDDDHFSIQQVARVRSAGRRAWCNSLGDWNLPGLGDYDFPELGSEVFTGLAGRGFSIIQTDLPSAALKALDEATLLVVEAASSEID